MKIQLFHSSYVINLFDFVDTDKIDQYFENVFKTTTDTLDINYESFRDWELCFKAFYVEGSQIRVFKGLKPYVNDKEKIITIHIPIPSKEEVNWGVQKNQLSTTILTDKILKNCVSFSVNFADSNSLLQHVINCLKTGILFSFQEGFTLMGEKIKIKTNIFEQ